MVFANILGEHDIKRVLEHFYLRCIRAIADELDKLDSVKNSPFRSSQRAALLHLRGVYHLARDNLVEGLKDLEATAKEDARYYPKRFVYVYTRIKFHIKSGKCLIRYQCCSTCGELEGRPELFRKLTSIIKYFVGGLYNVNFFLTLRTI